MGPHTLEYIVGTEAEAERAAQVIAVASRFATEKYGVVFDDSYSFVIGLNATTWWL